MSQKGVDVHVEQFGKFFMELRRVRVGDYFVEKAIPICCRLRKRSLRWALEEHFGWEILQIGSVLADTYDGG